MSNYIKTAVVIKKDNTYLLVQENSERVRGLWNLPQGTVDAGENLEDCAVREVKEETGLDVQLDKKIAVLNNTFKDTKELHVYQCSIAGGNLQIPEEEIMSAKFFTIEEIETIKDKLVGPWVYDVILSSI